MKKSHANSILQILEAVNGKSNKFLTYGRHHPPGNTTSRGGGTFLFCKERALLLQTGPYCPHQFMYEMPGGHFDEKKDLTLHDTARRETKEEAGIVVDLGHYKGKTRILEKSGYQYNIYSYEFDEEPEVFLNQEHVKHLWASWVDLHLLPLRNHIRKMYVKNGLTPQLDNE